MNRKTLKVLKVDFSSKKKKNTHIYLYFIATKYL